MKKKKNKVVLPCNIGDTVYGVSCCCPLDNIDGLYVPTGIIEHCNSISKQCAKCKYAMPCIAEFVCSEIRFERHNRIHVCGDRGEHYLEQYILTQFPQPLKSVRKRMQPKIIDNYLENYYDRTGTVATQNERY